MKRKDGQPKAPKPKLTKPFGDVKDFVVNNFKKDMKVYGFAKANNLQYAYVKRVVRECGLRA